MRSNAILHKVCSLILPVVIAKVKENVQWKREGKSHLTSIFLSVIGYYWSNSSICWGRAHWSCDIKK
jgi:hypothetical protein